MRLLLPHQPASQIEFFSSPLVAAWSILILPHHLSRVFCHITGKIPTSAHGKLGSYPTLPRRQGRQEVGTLYKARLWHSGLWLHLKRGHLWLSFAPQLRWESSKWISIWTPKRTFTKRVKPRFLKGVAIHTLFLFTFTANIVSSMLPVLFCYVKIYSD